MDRSGPGGALVSASGALLEDAQALPQAAEGGGGGGLQQEEVLVQAGEGATGRQGLDGLHQVLLLALGLGHHLEGGRREGGKYEGWRERGG